MNSVLDKIRYLKESEDHIEFKEAKKDFNFSGGSHVEPKKRRHCILGYVVALANEGGGRLIFGMADKYPHKIVGTNFAIGEIGNLESEIYKRLRIRIHISEEYDGDKRVLIFNVPSRPVGRFLTYEGVGLMRAGEDLREMSQDEMFSILSEQEPDFSATICKDATIDDLDDNAINTLKQKYALKQNNFSFMTLPKEQLLSDLGLVRGGNVTYAAIILVGKKETIERFLPQAVVMLEIRNTESQIVFDKRIKYDEPFYIMIDKLWHDIDLRNGKFSIKEGPYIFDVPYFNEEVIREAINNAIAHRDYKMTSEILIKQYPQRLVVINAGGFPRGVTIDNLLTVPSTPRNRLIAEVLSKTGIVERSGQGVDKIFRNTILEGKKLPDYSATDDYHVELSLSASIKNSALALFIETEQSQLLEENKLSVFEILALYSILDDNSKDVSKNVLQSLLERGLIEKHGKTKGVYYVLSRNYYEFTDDIATYSKKTEWNASQAISIIIPHLVKFGKAKMKDFVELFSGHLSRRQVKNIISQLVENNVLKIEGVGSGSIYSITEDYIKEMAIRQKALDLGLEELKNRGEIK